MATLCMCGMDGQWVGVGVGFAYIVMYMDMSVYCVVVQLCVTAERIELFLELFGNTLIRAQTSKYLQKKCDKLIK